jgi:hypothetical protein
MLKTCSTKTYSITQILPPVGAPKKENIPSGAGYTDFAIYYLDTTGAEQFWV